MRPFELYLGGTVSDLTFEEAMAWREDVRHDLENYKFSDGTPAFHCLNPLRGKECLSGTGPIAKGGLATIGVTSDHSITRMCKWDVLRCDIALFNFERAISRSLGSAGEIAWAEDHDKFVLTVIPDESNPHFHAFVNDLSSLIVPSIDDALDILRTLVS